MSIPTPNPDESHDDFMDRCTSAMSDEYEGDQLVAVCENAWKQDKESKSVCRRAFEADALSIEKREEGDDTPSKLVGHAAVFNMETDLGWFREKIAPGAFTEALKGDDVRALFNHNPDIILGRSKANTLRMWEDERGLGVEIDLPDTQQAKDLRTSIERGDVSQMSFAFQPVVDEWDQSEEPPLRTLKAVRLFDVSPVTYPAYPQTDVAARSYQVDARRSLLAHLKEQLEDEKIRKAEIEATKAESRDLLAAIKKGNV